MKINLNKVNLNLCFHGLETEHRHWSSLDIPVVIDPIKSRPTDVCNCFQKAMAVNTNGVESNKKTCRNCVQSRNCHLSHLSRNVLRARRGVVRMLIVVVLTFAVCNLPFHARKMWQYWSSGYEGTSDFSALLTPLTFLISYFNSGINPLLYAFLSKNFRKGMRELLFCSCHGRRKTENVIVMNPVGGAGLRRSSTRSTRANCSTVTMAPHAEL